jgi:hypothetical protein
MMLFDAGRLRTTWLFAGELLLVGFVLFAMDALAHLRLAIGPFFATWGAWVALLGVFRVLRTRARFHRWGVTFAESIAPFFFLNGLTAVGFGRFSVAQSLFALGLVGGLLNVGRWWVVRTEKRTGDIGEGLRILVVGVGAVAATLPLYTDRLVGGIDARWYSFMLGDFIAQLRAGIFPVFVGQGELAWNGGVHPFRSAPVFMYVAGLWDVLTRHALHAVALQHLAAITAAFAAGFGMYATGTRLVPWSRWAAVAVSLLYLGAPASLEALYHGDAYMTWMALGALPLALYGNAKVLLLEDGRGYVPLAAGLALVWMCHPPLAMLTTMATLLLQGGSLLCGEVTAARLRGAAGGALLFVGLGVFYFYGMGELPPQNSASLRADVFQIAGLALWLAGLAGAVIRRRGRWWLALLVPGGWLLGLARLPWLWWMLLTAALVFAVAALARRRRWFDPAERSIEVLYSCAIVAAGLTLAWLGPTHPARDVARLQDFKDIVAHSESYFLPLSPLVDQPGDWQPGIGLWMAILALGALSIRKGALATKVWFAVTLLPFFIFVRVPWVSEFLVGYAPRWFAAVAGLTFSLRLMPALAALLAVGWFVSLAGRGERGRSERLLMGLGFALAVGFAVQQAAKVERAGFRATATRTSTEDRFRAENAVLERFAYDLLPQPSYYSNGLVDPRLEVRAFDEKNGLLSDPDITATRMEQAGCSELKLVCLPFEPPAPAWLRLGPTLTVAPGEHFLLRFEFDPARNYSGYLFLISNRGYREYALPESGLRRAFGTTDKASRVISLWNTGVVNERYEFSFRRGPGCTLPADGSVFANVMVSRYEPSLAWVRVDSLLPYRVTSALERPVLLETPRVWLPGYAASVDGFPAEVKASAERLVAVPVPAGRHTVEVRYVGTMGLWLTWWTSALTWGGLIGSFAWRCRRANQSVL